jgi:hypothetical protein
MEHAFQHDRQVRVLAEEPQVRPGERLVAEDLEEQVDGRLRVRLGWRLERRPERGVGEVVRDAFAVEKRVVSPFE